MGTSYWDQVKVNLWKSWLVRKRKPVRRDKSYFHQTILTRSIVVAMEPGGAVAHILGINSLHASGHKVTSPK